MAKKILIVDDDEALLKTFSFIISHEGYECIISHSGDEAIAKVKSEDVDFVFLDFLLPGTDGVEIFKEIKTIKPNLPVVIMTGYVEKEVTQNIKDSGSFGILYKPFDVEKISNILEDYFKGQEGKS